MNRGGTSYLLVVNPVAGRGGGRSRAGALEEALAASARVEIMETRGRGDATEIAALHGPGHHRVIAVGGDGTLNEVLTGLWSLGRPAVDLPELGFLPAGTANAAAPAFGLRTDPVAVARSLASTGAIDGAASKPVDFGVVRSETGERPFLLWCGAGYDAVVIDALNSSRTGRMGLLGLLRNAPTVAAHIARYDEAPVRPVVDGDRWSDSGGVIVANVADIAFGGTIAEAADAFDGRLDVVAAPTGLKLRVPFLGLSMLGSGLQNAPGIRWQAASVVELSSDGSVPVQIDGEPAGHLPVEVRVVPRGIRLLLT